MLLFVLTRRKDGGGTSSVVSEMTLSLDTQKERSGTGGARIATTPSQNEEDERSKWAGNAAAPARASIAQREQQRAMEQDFGAQTVHANLKGRRCSACMIPAAPRRNTFDARTTHRWRIALCRESSFGDLWYPCARTKKMMCGVPLRQSNT